MGTMIMITSRDMYRAAIHISQNIVKMVLLNELKTRMRRGVVKFAYLKKSGEVRIAYGTMMPTLVDDHINGRGNCGDVRKVCTYFDVERGNFRCFQIHSLIKIF